MSSTNSTNNYNLSQYVNNDKPTYLGDYNADMAKIDTALHTNATNIQTATQTANQATQTANTANTTAETAQNTANTANTTANSALTKATANENNLNKFNLTQYNTLTLTTTEGQLLSIEDNPLTIAKDTTGSIFKLYGAFILNLTAPTTSSVIIVKTNDTGLRPASAYFINPIGLRIIGKFNNSGEITYPLKAKVNTDGTIDFYLFFDQTFSSARVICLPCLYFNENFGDI